MFSMAPFPEYPGIKPNGLSTYTEDYNDKTPPLVLSSPARGTNPQEPANYLLPRPPKKMPSKTLKAEVRSAVQEYLSSLISERSRPGQGHGMAVSTTDLMVTTKTAGYHGTATRASRIPHHRSKSVPPPAELSFGRASVDQLELPSKSEEKNKKDSHWSVWKTTPSTSPSVAPGETSGVNSPPSPPPRTPVPRPASCRPGTSRSRCSTPGENCSGDVQQTPVNFRPPSVILCSRPPTPAPLSTPDLPLPERRVPTPMSLQPGHHDNLSSAHRISTEGTPQPVYIPALNAWISNAEEHEKEVAYNLFKALNAGMKPLRIPTVKPRVRARSASASQPSRRLPVSPTRLYHPPTAGIRTSQPAPKVYLDHKLQNQYISLVGRSLHIDPYHYGITPDMFSRYRIETPPDPYKSNVMTNSRPTTTRPWPTHLNAMTNSDCRSTTTRPWPTHLNVMTNSYCMPTTTRPWPTHLSGAPPPIEYTHENSFFVNSMQPYRSHFTIHPEWVSETKAGQREFKLLKSTQDPNGIRYMAQ